MGRRIDILLAPIRKWVHQRTSHQWGCLMLLTVMVAFWAGIILIVRGFVVQGALVIALPWCATFFTAEAVDTMYREEQQKDDYLN